MDLVTWCLNAALEIEKSIAEHNIKNGLIGEMAVGLNRKLNMENERLTKTVIDAAAVITSKDEKIRALEKEIADLKGEMEMELETETETELEDGNGNEVEVVATRAKAHVQVPLPVQVQVQVPVQPEAKKSQEKVDEKTKAKLRAMWQEKKKGGAGVAHPLPPRPTWM